MNDDISSRYDRQVRFAPLGAEGQRRLATARALVCGCGALGSVVAELLARAGVGFLRIVDRDFVELNNLQRQVLFDEIDVANTMPKAVAAAEKLRRVNSSIAIEPVVADLTHTNIARLAGDVDVIVDGTDNFATRFLVNDFCVKHDKPWVYGGAIGAEGQSMTIVPHDTACLACLLPEPPPPGITPTCDTAGILGPVIGIIGSIEACEAIKLLSGNREAISRSLAVIELWDNRLRQVDLTKLRDQSDCHVCRHGEFHWLSGSRGGASAVLCGRNAVQVAAPVGTTLSLDELAARLEGLGTVTRNPFLLRLTIGEHLLTIFPDGRTIVGGTDDVAVARSLHARYVGS
jgi:molybdopterin-synthase adenylyltransferase